MEGVNRGGRTIKFADAPSHGGAGGPIATRGKRSPASCCESALSLDFVQWWLLLRWEAVNFGRSPEGFSTSSLIENYFI